MRKHAQRGRFKVIPQTCSGAQRYRFCYQIPGSSYFFMLICFFPESVQFFLIGRLNVKEYPLLNTDLVPWFLHLFSKRPLLPV